VNEYNETGRAADRGPHPYVQSKRKQDMCGTCGYTEGFFQHAVHQQRVRDAATATWRVHIDGPDEYLPAKSHLDAVLQANAINMAAAITAAENNPYAPFVWATPERTATQ
jgi:hypothetical protein